jgi:hypothetical protein
MDTNVHPNMTLLLINELIRHNKDFDVVVMPNRGHGFANEPFFIRKTWDYFVRHLLDQEPPREFEVGVCAYNDRMRHRQLQRRRTLVQCDFVGNCIDGDEVRKRPTAEAELIPSLRPLW